VISLNFNFHNPPLVIQGHNPLNKMAKKKSEDKKTFQAELDGMVYEFEFVAHKFIVPGKGTVTSDQALEDEEIIARLVSKESGVIKKVKEVGPAKDSDTGKKGGE